MRRFKFLGVAVLAVALAGLIFGTACAGDIGPEGPRGEPGAQGSQGLQSTIFRQFPARCARS